MSLPIRDFDKKKIKKKIKKIKKTISHGTASHVHVLLIPICILSVDKAFICQSIWLDMTDLQAKSTELYREHVTRFLTRTEKQTIENTQWKLEEGVTIVMITSKGKTLLGKVRALNLRRAEAGCVGLRLGWIRWFSTAQLQYSNTIFVIFTA